MCILFQAVWEAVPHYNEHEQLLSYTQFSHQLPCVGRTLEYPLMRKLQFTYFMLVAKLIILIFFTIA